ncbi:MAG: radical SAM protein [Fibrobacter sp.]|nr:radical SAM protein [Fibrobacter sp.]
MNLVLNLTEQCNLRCSYCYYNESQAARFYSMTPDILERAIAFGFHYAMELGQQFLNITFFGGEPLLKKSLILQGIELAKQYKPENMRLQFAVNTNGTLLNAFWLDLFKRENFYIYLSLDGPAEIHNQQRYTLRHKGSFPLIEPYLKTLSQLNTTILRIITHKHIHGLSDSLKWMAQQGFNKISTAVDFNGQWTPENFAELHREYAQIADYWVALKKQNSPIYLGTIQDKIRLEAEGSSYKKITCSILQNIVAVSAQGGLFPCTRFVSSQPDALYQIGDVFTGIDNSKTGEIQAFLNSDKASCQDCELKRRCVGNECGCITFSTTQTLSQVSPEVCTHERMLAAICDAAALQLL